MNLFTIIPFQWAKVVFKSCHCRTNLCFNDKFYCLKKSSYLTLLHKEKVCFFLIFFSILWVELGGIIVTFGLLQYLPMTLAGKMVITWENKVEWWAFEVMLTESGCVLFILWMEKMVSKVKVIFMCLEVGGYKWTDINFKDTLRLHI